MAPRPVWTDEADMVAALRPLLGDAPAGLDFYRSGWDSVAIAAGERMFKFPRHAEALAALRREIAILEQVAPVSPLRVPSMILHDGARPFSEHVLIPGDHLLKAGYERLDPPRRDALADALAGFHAAIHRLDPARMRAIGAGPVEAWLPPEAVERFALPALPAAWRGPAAAIVAAYADLPPDPAGEVYGHFDAHGWNMAFDSPAGRLNGLYDFADSGIGPLHREFICSSFVSRDLTERIIGRYERHATRSIDRGRVGCLTGYHRLWELAVAVRDGGPADDMRASALDWLAGL